MDSLLLGFGSLAIGILLWFSVGSEVVEADHESENIFKLMKFRKGVTAKNLFKHAFRVVFMYVLVMLTLYLCDKFLGIPWVVQTENGLEGLDFKPLAGLWVVPFALDIYIMLRYTIFPSYDAEAEQNKISQTIQISE